MSVIGQLFVAVLALIGVAILVGGAVEGSTETIIAGGFWLGFAIIVWFVGYRRDKADEAKDALVRRFSEISSRSNQAPTTSYEVIDAYPNAEQELPQEQRRRELMEKKRELLLEEELEDEIEELEERRRERRLRRGRDIRKLPPGA